MGPRAECETGIHHNANPAWRRGVVSPLGTYEDAVADFHRLQILVGKCDPIACVGWFYFAAEAGLKFGLARIFIEKRS